MDKCKVECIPKCFIISLKRRSHAVKGLSGDELYSRFVKINSRPYWNLDLKDILENCEFLGFVKPYNILLKAEDIFVQSLRLAQEKRLLKAPDGFIISYVGQMEPAKCITIQPSQFVALDEALCYIIYDLNLKSETSSFELICTKLAEWYAGLQLPPQSLILATLRSLLDSGQVYYTGYGYNILTTDKAIVAQWLEEQTPNAPLAKIDGDTTTDVEEKVPENLKATSDPIVSTEDDGEEIKGKNKKTKQNYCSKTIDGRRSTTEQQQLPNQTTSSGTMTDNVHYLDQYGTVTPAIFLAPAHVTLGNNSGYYPITQEIRKKKGKSKSMVKNFFSRFRSSHHHSNAIKSSSSRTRSSTADTGYFDGYEDEDPLYQYTAPASVALPPTSKSMLTNGGNLRSHLRQGQWFWHTSLQSLPPVETYAYYHHHISPTHRPTNLLESNQQTNQNSSNENNHNNSSSNGGGGINGGGGCRRSVSSHSRLSTQAIHDDSPPKRSTSFTHALFSSSQRQHRRHRSNSGHKRNSGDHENNNQNRKSHRHKKRDHGNKIAHSNGHLSNDINNQDDFQLDEYGKYPMESSYHSHYQTNNIDDLSPPLHRLKSSGVQNNSANYMLSGVDSGVHSVSESHTQRTNNNESPAAVVTNQNGGSDEKRGNHRYFRSLELDPQMTGLNPSNSSRSSSFHTTSGSISGYNKISRSFSSKLSQNNSNRQSLDPVLESQNNIAPSRRYSNHTKQFHHPDFKRHVAFQEQR